MRRILMVLILGLAGCNTPSAKFRGVEPVRMQVGQSTFDIRVGGLRAEAIRLNAEWAPRLAAVAPRAVVAMERVSGCTVHDLEGDQARMVARLDCGDGPPPAPPYFPDLDCELYVLDEDYGEMFCQPYP